MNSANQTKSSQTKIKKTVSKLKNLRDKVVSCKMYPITGEFKYGDIKKMIFLIWYMLFIENFIFA